MNKKRVALFFLLISFISFSSFVMAALPPADGITDIGVLIQNIIKIIWIAFVAIVVVCFIIAGIDFLIARGNPAKIEEARRFVIWGVVGVAVAIIGFSIIKLVQGSLIASG